MTASHRAGGPKVSFLPPPLLGPPAFFPAGLLRCRPSGPTARASPSRPD